MLSLKERPDYGLRRGDCSYIEGNRVKSHPVSAIKSSENILWSGSELAQVGSIFV